MTEYCIPFDHESVKSLAVSLASGPPPQIDADGRQRVFLRDRAIDFIGAVKVEIFSNEHPPPHFRVIYQGSSANFSIANCERLNGSGQILRQEKKVRKWWKENKQLLIEAWNSSRPSSCPVGQYQE